MDAKQSFEVILLEEAREFIRNQDMKTYTMNEVLDEEFGPKGTKDRDDFDKAVADDIQAWRVGEAIKKARLAKHMTQEELGEKIGVQRSQISRLEKGHSMTISSLMRVFRALGVKTSLNMQGVGSVALC